MTTTPAQLFESFFAELDRQDIPYVILHSYETLPESIPSDVDFAVAAESLHRVPNLMRAVAAQAGWLLVQTLQHETTAFYSVLMDPANPRQFLKLDYCSDYVRNGCRLVSVADLLAGRRRFKTFWVPSPAAEFIYTLTKALAKKKDMAQVVPKLQRLWQAEPERSAKWFGKIFGTGAGPLAEWFQRPAESWVQLAASLRRRNRYRLPQRLAEWRRRWRRVRQPTGITLVVLGADGTGKSAVIERLKVLLAPPFRRMAQYHFCPMLCRRQHTGVVTVPHALPPRCTLVSWVKVFYHFADHWLGYLLQQWPARVQSTCIIFDRHFDDLLIDPRRYRIQRAGWLVRVLRRLLPPRDRLYGLDAPPEVIRQRKAELSVEELDRQRAALRQLAQIEKRLLIVDCTQPIEVVANTIAREVIEFLADRQRRRDGF